jgi:hypothetical protein
VLDEVDPQAGQEATPDTPYYLRDLCRPGRVNATESVPASFG